MDSAPNLHPSPCGFPPHSARSFYLWQSHTWTQEATTRSCNKKLQPAIPGAREDRRIMQDSSHPAEGTTQLGKLSERLALKNSGVLNCQGPVPSSIK